MSWNCDGLFAAVWLCRAFLLLWSCRQVLAPTPVHKSLKTRTETHFRVALFDATPNIKSAVSGICVWRELSASSHFPNPFFSIWGFVFVFCFSTLWSCREDAVMTQRWGSGFKISPGLWGRYHAACFLHNTKPGSFFSLDTVENRQDEVEEAFVPQPSSKQDNFLFFMLTVSESDVTAK